MSDAALSGQVILVTGAANGLGSEVAKSCANAGATLVLLDKDLPGLESIYDLITHSSGKHTLYPFDLKGASITDYADLASSITSHFGRLDALVHCAAVLGQLAPVEHQNLQTWAETLHINLTAPFMLTQACLPLMKSQAKASILFTTDQHKDKAYWSSYGISKAGIETLAKQLKDELEVEQKIQVHCVDPGQFQSQLLSQAFPALSPDNLPLPATVASVYLALLKH